MMEQLDQWLDLITGGNEISNTAAHILLVVLAILLLNLILRKVLARFGRAASQTDMPWDSALISAARRPLSALVWIIGISFVGQIVATRYHSAILDHIPQVRIVGIIICVGWMLMRFIHFAKEAILARKAKKTDTVDRTTIDAISQLLRIVVCIMTALFALQSMGVSVEGALAFGGIGGLAIGLAAREMLANFFGSLMLYLDRPFAIGDWIRSPDKSIEGTVEEIGWRQTRIRTFDMRPLYVPNSVFTSISVENASRMTNRRINVTIGVRYDDFSAVKGIVDDVRAMLQAEPGIDQAKGVIVNFVQFNEFSLDILVTVFTRTTQKAKFYEIQQDVLLKIGEIIASHGAEIAFPTRVTYNQTLPTPAAAQPTAPQQPVAPQPSAA
ncbi:MAG: mechanosensitive ion channel family protein [Azoarcus sp.]|jgi:MscS family membrane protein|nr:mechanosensitive ion channel family protein [Azoarcus sp.]